MLHSHLSTSRAGEFILGHRRILALFASVALFLSTGCRLDSPTVAGPGGQGAEFENEDRRSRHDVDTAGPRPRPRPLSTAQAAAVHRGIPRLTGGATQISGIGYYAEPGQCEDPEGQGSDYALVMTGDLEGCLYIFVETSKCSAGGAYVETGTETFVGRYGGAPGTFRTTYLFTAKYRDCANLAGQIAGRCQHPMIAGSGDGIFEGVTGRFDMTDDVEAGNFAYRGHFRS
jgi:hypothetical protein